MRSAGAARLDSGRSLLSGTTTVAAVRSGLGSAQPYDILPAVWLTSALSVTVGVLAARLLRGGGRL